jgi:hypothetical protein
MLVRDIAASAAARKIVRIKASLASEPCIKRIATALCPM